MTGSTTSGGVSLARSSTAMELHRWRSHSPIYDRSYFCRVQQSREQGSWKAHHHWLLTHAHLALQSENRPAALHNKLASTACGSLEGTMSDWLSAAASVYLHASNPPECHHTSTQYIPQYCDRSTAARKLPSL